MSFGFSIGDFVTVIKLIKDVTVALKSSGESVPEYASLIQTLDSLKRVVTISEIHLICETLPTTEGHRKHYQDIINGIIFHRQQCKELIEKFLELTKPYRDAFLGPFQVRGSGIRKGYWKIRWFYSKDNVAKFESDMQMHLKVLEMYTDALTKIQTEASSFQMSSNIQGILSIITNVHTEVSTMSTALQRYQQSVMSGLGYGFWDASSLADSVVLLDPLGRKIILPLMLCNSPQTLHRILPMVFHKIPGSGKILRKEYTITEENEEGTLFEENNWGQLIRPGIRLELNMILKVSSEWSNSQCPKCKDSILGNPLPGKRIRCHKCQLTYQVFNHERFIEESDGFSGPPPVEEESSSFVDNIVPRPRVNSFLSRTATLNRRNSLLESSFFQRIHYHREILKFLPASAGRHQHAQTTKRIEKSPILEIDLLPRLHKYAAKGLLIEMEQTLGDNDRSIDEALTFGAMIENDGVDCELHGCTPLQLACWFGQIKAITFLLDRGADINKKSSTGLAALSFAILGEDPGVAIGLLERGADVHSKDGYQRTPFHHAGCISNATAIHLLVKEGIDHMARDKNGGTALHYACYRGREAVVKVLVRIDVDVNAKDECGLTPLHISARDGWHAICKMLIDGSANVNARSKRGYTPLHFACNNGHDLTVKMLLGLGANINDQTSDKDTPLHRAFLSRNEAVVRTLLGLGADINIRNARGQTALHGAALMASDASYQFLIEHGANIGERCNYGHHLLHYAAMSGCVSIIKRHTKGDGAGIPSPDQEENTPSHSASVRQENVENVDSISTLPASLSIDAATLQSKSGELPLHLACLYGHLEAAQLLLEANPDIVNTPTHYGKTPLHYACHKEHLSIAEILLRTSSINIDAIDKNGYTPLHCAAEKGHEGVVSLLLKSGAAVNTRNSNEDTPLMSAIEGSFITIVKLLLDQNADLSIISEEGYSLLHVTALMGDTAIARLLIEYGHDPSAKSIDGVAPLHTAALGGATDVVKLLLEYGHDPSSRPTGGDMADATPMMLAAMSGSPNIIELLAGAGADLNAQCRRDASEPGPNALVAAVMFHRISTIQMIASLGADLNSRCSPLHATPLILALWHGAHHEVIEVLLDIGCDPKLSMQCGYTTSDLALINLLCSGDKDSRKIMKTLYQTSRLDYSSWKLEVSEDEVKVKSVSVSYWHALLNKSIKYYNDFDDCIIRRERAESELSKLDSAGGLDESGLVEPYGSSQVLTETLQLDMLPSFEKWPTQETIDQIFLTLKE